MVRVEVPGRDGFLAVIDTGFNRTLILEAAEASAMGLTITTELEIVELATTARVQVHRGIGKIWWLDQQMVVEALISNEPPAVHRPDSARALIGTELLTNCLLLIDFSTQNVEIETQT